MGKIAHFGRRAPKFLYSQRCPRARSLLSRWPCTFLWKIDSRSASYWCTGPLVDPGIKASGRVVAAVPSYPVVACHVQHRLLHPRALDISTGGMFCQRGVLILL